IRAVETRITVAVSTVSFIIKRKSETGANFDRKRSGRPKATTESEDKFLRVDRRLTGQPLQAQLNSGRSKQVSVSTVKRRLPAAGLTGRVAARKPLLRRQNKTKRLAWFEIFGSSRRIFVRHRAGERMLPQCVASTVKHGGGSVMIWGCFAGSRVGDLFRVRGTLNQNSYHSMLQLGQGFIFQQDNDPKQKSKLCQNYLVKKEEAGKLENMERPAQSPDLNPIELVWDEIDRRVKAKQPTSATHLWELLQQTWEELSEDSLISVVERMPRVCSAVISAKGGYFDESTV
uniref:Transposase Tc1-like domain-containing protein n=1 Tax=Salarias fasciatus TaxID=181472 RepID=A0A672IYI2_SALFA